MTPPLLYRSEAFAEDLIDPPAAAPSARPARRLRPWSLAVWPALVAAVGGSSLMALWLPV